MSTNTAPFTVQPKLTQIAMAVKPQGMIADKVCPRVTVPGEKFIYTKMSTEEVFTIQDTRVGRTGAPNQVEFGGVDVTDSTEDYGLDDPVPNKDIKNAEGTNYDPLAAAAERTTILVELAREKRVADLMFSLNTYAASLRSTLSGTGQWSDYANSDPVNAILMMFDGMLIRPNVGILGRAVWTKLRMHPKVVAAVLNAGKGNGGAAAAGVIARKAVADLLELDDIYVGEAFANTAKKGQAAAYARLWGKHAAFARIDPNVRDARAAIPTFAMTAQWGDRVGGTIPDANIGLDGGQKVRVGEHVKELIAFQECGCFFQNAVA
jgi:hypothetical protein